MAYVPVPRKAERKQCKLSLLINGFTGRGKSGLAMAMASVFAEGDWDKIHVNDTENKSLDLLVGTMMHIGKPYGQFQVYDLTEATGYKPEYYRATRDYAVKHKGLVYIGDSITHMWTHRGGILDMVDEAQAENSSLNYWSAWKEPQIVKAKQDIMSIIRSADIHCINTVRVKDKKELITNEDGKKEIRSLGMEEVTMPLLDYEPDLVLEMVRPGNMDGTSPLAKVVKSRYAILKERESYEFNESLILQLKEYLEEGTSPEELLERQRTDYLNAITDFLDNHPKEKQIWKIIKSDLGCEGKKITTMKLVDLKEGLLRLTSE